MKAPVLASRQRSRMDHVGCIQVQVQVQVPRGGCSRRQQPALPHLCSLGRAGTFSLHMCAGRQLQGPTWCRGAGGITQTANVPVACPPIRSLTSTAAVGGLQQ